MGDECPGNGVTVSGNSDRNGIRSIMFCVGKYHVGDLVSGRRTIRWCSMLSMRHHSDSKDQIAQRQINYKAFSVNNNLIQNSQTTNIFALHY